MTPRVLVVPATVHRGETRHVLESWTSPRFKVHVGKVHLRQQVSFQVLAFELHQGSVVGLVGVIQPFQAPLEIGSVRFLLDEGTLGRMQG